MLWYKRRLIVLLCFMTAVLAGSLIYIRMPGGAGHPLFQAGKGKKERMLDYMKEKYGEEFVDEEAYGGQLGKAYVMRRVHSISRPKDSVLVRAMGEEEEIFQDNYLAYLLRDEIEERMKGLATEVFGECKVFYKIPELVFPSEFSADMEVDAFLRHPLSMVRIYVYVKDCPLDRQRQADDFLSTLSKEGYLIGGVISYSAGEEMYEMITADNFVGDIYHGYRREAEAVFSMKKRKELSYLRWNSSLE